MKETKNAPVALKLRHSYKVTTLPAVRSGTPLNPPQPAQPNAAGLNLTQQGTNIRG